MRRLPFCWYFGVFLLLAACHTEPKTAGHSQQIPAPAATKTKPVAPAAVVSLAAFVPAGFGILDSATGDLNRDAWPDRILVLRKDGEDTTTLVDLDRPLLLLLGRPDHRFILAARSNRVVLRRNEGGAYGDPYAGLTIKRGFFSVEHYGGSSARWSRIITFNYAPATRTWYLSREGGESYSVFDPDNVTSEAHTPRNFGRVPFAKYDVDSTY